MVQASPIEAPRAPEAPSSAAVAEPAGRCTRAPAPTTSADATELMRTFARTRSALAFEELYAATSADLVGWIRGLARNRRPGADPHDLLQDTFVNIYRYAGSFKPDAPGGFGAWSRTIAANVVRRSGVRPQSAGTLFADCDGAERFVADAAGTPARAAEDREETGQLHAAYLVLLQHYAHAFGALKERDRRALELVEVEGLDYAEVGRRLGTRRSNTKMILFRARKRLLAAMETSLAGPDRAAEAA